MNIIGEQNIINCDLFDAFVQEINELRLFRFTINEVSHLDDSAIELLLKSLQMIAEETVARNIIVLDGTALSNRVSLLRQFLQIYFERINSMPATGLKKFVLVTDSSLLVFTTNMLKTLNSTQDIVIAVQTMEEAQKIINEQ